MGNLVKYQKIVDDVLEESAILKGEAQEKLKKDAEEFLNYAQDSRFIKVPLVGVFSAGKSSLLNVFTQKPGMLPVDTMPETAVAYELYYSQTESVELYRDNKKIDSKPLADIKQLQTEPGDIAKVYCDSETIKALQERGIILVDMPGIGSGIERHDAAIFNYISSGTAFVLIVDAEQGSLRGSTLSFMHELSQYNMHPAVLVSKIDKKPEGDVKDIVEYINYQLTRLGDKNPFVSTVCAVNKNLEGLNKYLYSLEPENLIAEKLGKKLRLIINSAIEQLKIRVDIRNKDINDADERLKAINDEIAKVKAELPTDKGNADSPEKSTQDILDNVCKALEEKSTDIAQMIINKEDQESIKQTIVSTVRMTVINSLKEESEQYSTALGGALQESIKDLPAIEVNDDFMNDFNDIFDVVHDYIDVLLSAGGIWGELAKVLLPFLPKIVNWLFGKSDEEVLEEVRAKVMAKCVSQVAVGLQPILFKITVDNQKRIDNKIQAEIVSKMEKVKEGMQEKIDDANKSKEEIQAEIEKINGAIDRLTAMLNNI